MKLAELERYFAAAATSGSGPIAGLAEVFVSRGSLSASERLAIYNRGYFYRLLEALASVFSETKRVLGAPEFERIGLSYLARHPSEHPAIERVGRLFADYLRAVQPPGSALADLAALEWARLCALVAPDPSALADARAIAPSEFPRARLRLIPSWQCLELDARALRAFAGEALDSAASADQPALELRAVAVWRAGHAVSHEPLEAEEFQALRVCARGAPMAEVCAQFDSGSTAEASRRAFQAVSGWFARSWVESVTVLGP